MRRIKYRKSCYLAVSFLRCLLLVASCFPSFSSSISIPPSALALLTHAPSYKVGDAFISLPQPEVLALLTSSTERIDEEVQALKDSVEGIHEEMEGLKKALYGRFGRSINLET
jgi:hypothetical protein